VDTSEFVRVIDKASKTRSKCEIVKFDSTGFEAHLLLLMMFQKPAGSNDQALRLVKGGHPPTALGSVPFKVLVSFMMFGNRTQSHSKLYRMFLWLLLLILPYITSAVPTKLLSHVVSRDPSDDAS
jgi:hypothetical protein